MAEIDDTKEKKNQADNKERDETEKDGTTTNSDMAPWEQHSSVIIIPRYNYKAPSSLLEHSHCGFLITCPIKREKSATKEAMSILEKHVESAISTSSNTTEISDEGEAPKRRKIFIEENHDESCTNVPEIRSSTTPEDDGKPSKTSSPPGIEKTNTATSDIVLSLVKLTRSGLLLFTFPKDCCLDTVQILSNILQSIETKNLKTPQWCHRILPIQATCSLNENDLQKVVSRLVLQFVSDKKNQLSQPLKFAVGYNRRGIEEKEMKTVKQPSKDDASLPEMLDRTKCFSVVAAAVKSVVSDSVVDLKSPELTVLVELLPLSSVSSGSLVVAISVLPQNLVSVKPKLGIKALISDSKPKPRKS